MPLLLPPLVCSLYVGTDRVRSGDAASSLPPASVAGADESCSIYRRTQARLLHEHSVAVAMFEPRFRSQCRCSSLSFHVLLTLSVATTATASVRPSLCIIVQSEHDATMLSNIADIVVQTLADVATNRTAIFEASPSTPSAVSKGSSYSAAG